MRPRRAGSTLAPTLALSAAVALAGAVAEAAPPPLSQNDYINDRLFAAAVGDEIRKNCGSISARMVYVLVQLQRLKSYARSQGYTDAQMEAYVEDKAEQDKMRARRDAYLASHGVTKGDEASYCALGRKEIAAGTITGSLLRD